MRVVPDRFPSYMRSRIMASIRSNDTGPEIAVRRIMWGLGFRYRTHDRTVPGTPDISNKRRRYAIFVDGCFWHGCPECYREPKTNTAFWRDKVRRNMKRRNDVSDELKRQGFRVVEIWEHEVSEPESVVAKLNVIIGK